MGPVKYKPNSLSVTIIYKIKQFILTFEIPLCKIRWLDVLSFHIIYYYEKMKQFRLKKISIFIHHTNVEFLKMTLRIGVSTMKF